MGTKAFLQKGRTKPGIVLPANAQAVVNESRDRRALIRAAEASESKTSVEAVEVEASVVKWPDDDTPVTASAKVEVAPETPEMIQEPVEPEVAVEAVEAAETAVEALPEGPTPITIISGIGTALAERFGAYGYGTLDRLADADADTINQIPGARQRGQQWIDAARKYLGRI